MQGAERRVYRVSPDPVADATVRLEPLDGGTLGEARIADMSLNGLGVILAPNGRSALPRGERVRFEICLSGGAPIASIARTRFVVELPDGRLRVGLEFEEPDAMLVAIPAEWFHLFNRRQSQRTHGLALSAWIDLDGDSAPARIVSLSLSGAGVIVLTGAELDLYPRRVIELSFDAPVDATARADVRMHEISLFATVTDSGQRVTEAGFLPYVGLAFLPRKTAAFKAKSLAISRAIRGAEEGEGGTGELQPGSARGSFAR